MLGCGNAVWLVDGVDYDQRVDVMALVVSDVFALCGVVKELVIKLRDMLKGEGEEMLVG